VFSALPLVANRRKFSPEPRLNIRLPIRLRQRLFANPPLRASDVDISASTR